MQNSRIIILLAPFILMACATKTETTDSADSASNTKTSRIVGVIQDPEFKRIRDQMGRKGSLVLNKDEVQFVTYLRVPEVERHLDESLLSKRGILQKMASTEPDALRGNICFNMIFKSTGKQDYTSDPWLVTIVVNGRKAALVDYKMWATDIYSVNRPPQRLAGEGQAHGCTQQTFEDKVKSVTFKLVHPKYKKELSLHWKAPWPLVTAALLK